MKVYHLYCVYEPDGYGVFKTREEAQACIDMMVSMDHGGEDCYPEDFTIEEHYLN